MQHPVFRSFCSSPCIAMNIILSDVAISTGLLSASPSGFAIREQVPPLGPQLSWRDFQAVGSAKAHSFVGGAQLMKPFGEVLIVADPALQQSNSA